MHWTLHEAKQVRIKKKLRRKGYRNLVWIEVNRAIFFFTRSEALMVSLATSCSSNYSIRESGTHNEDSAFDLQNKITSIDPTLNCFKTIPVRHAGGMYRNSHHISFKLPRPSVSLPKSMSAWALPPGMVFRVPKGPPYRADFTPSNMHHTLSEGSCMLYVTKTQQLIRFSSRNWLSHGPWILVCKFTPKAYRQNYF